MTRLLLGLAMILAVLPPPAGAQLLSEEVRDTVRLCTYFGNDINADGEVLPRTATVGLGQNCPAVAPYRDPNAAIPPNAALTGERTGTTNRVCLYEEAGIQYQVGVELALRCAVTPALLARMREEGR